MDEQVEYVFSELTRSSRISIALTLLGVVFLAVSVLYSFTRLQPLEAQIDQKRKELELIEAELNEKKNALEKIAPAAKQSLGYKDPYAEVSDQILEQSAEARRAAEKLADPAERVRRRDIEVQYFPRKLDDEVDMNVVLSLLSEAGFTLKPEEPKHPEIPTNTVWFGNDVRLDDVKLIAYTLIGAGVQLRAVKPFTHSAAPRRLIQIGADPDNTGAPAMTFKQISEARSFTP